MITGIPAYASPPFQSLRCECGVRFVVLVGSEDHKERARAEAERINADFVDARRLLAFECYCGERLDVSPDASLSIQ